MGFPFMFDGKYQFNGSDVALIASPLRIATDEVEIPTLPMLLN